MTLNSKIPEGDIIQIQHENLAGAKRVLLHGKTSGGAYVPLLVDNTGVIAGYWKRTGTTIETRTAGDTIKTTGTVEADQLVVVGVTADDIRGTSGGDLLMASDLDFDVSNNYQIKNAGDITSVGAIEGYDIAGTNFLDSGGTTMFDFVTAYTVDFKDNDITTTGTGSFNQLGVGDGVVANAVINAKMSATDIYGLRIDGSTNDYTGTGTSFSYAMEFIRDHAVAAGTEPANLYTMLIENASKHSDAVLTNSKFNYGIYGNVNDTASWTCENGVSRSLSQIGVRGNVSLKGSYIGEGASGKLTLNTYGVKGTLNVDGTWNLATGNVFHYFKGVSGVVNTNPVSTTGGQYFISSGLHSNVTSTTEGVSWNYGLYIENVSGGDTNYGIMDSSGADWRMASDNQKIRIGATGTDLEIYSDGTYGRLDSTSGIILGNKLAFTQTDGNEYIDSLNDGYLDYRATTAHRFGDGTNQLVVASDGTITLEGTARIWKEIQFYPSSFAPGASGATETLLGNYDGWAYSINDEMVSSLEIPDDWDSSTDLEIKIYWYIDEAYATNNGEVRWQVEWSATPPDDTEVIDAPTHTGTVDFGDTDISATAKHLVRTASGTIPAGSLSEGDLVGLKLKRVALVGGSNPTAEPVVVNLEVEFIANKLGEES